MKSSLVRFYTADGAELQGVFSEPSEPDGRVLVHVHGHAGNFYENRFLDYYSEYLAEKGIAFLSFNNRGHDYINDILIKSESGIVFEKGGSAYERLEWSIRDIEASINFVNGKGYYDVVLQGHSLGCNKVMNYILKPGIPKIDKCVLLAPCDIVGFEIECDGKELYEELCVSSEKMLDSGNGKEILSYDNLISAAAFSDFRIEDCDADIFRYRCDGYVHNGLNGLDKKIMIILGDNDEYISDLKRCEEFFRNNVDEENLNFKIVKGASHNFSGFEDMLIREIIKFI